MGPEDPFRASRAPARYQALTVSLVGMNALEMSEHNLAIQPVRVLLPRVSDDLIGDDLFVVARE